MVTHLEGRPPIGPSLAVSCSQPVTCGSAQDWNQEYWGTLLGYDEVIDLTASGSLTVPGLGHSIYASDGTYIFADEKKSTRRFGVFEVRKDGSLCVEFYPDRRGQCTVFLRRNELVFLLTEEGERFPVSLIIQSD